MDDGTVEEQQPTPTFEDELGLDEPKPSKRKSKPSNQEDPLDDMDAELDLKQFLKNMDDDD